MTAISPSRVGRAMSFHKYSEIDDSRTIAGIKWILQ